MTTSVSMSLLTVGLAYLLVCGLVGWVAARRGYSAVLGAVLAFVATPLVGLLVVVLLPSRTAGYLPLEAR